MAIGFRNQTQIASGGATDPLSAPALPASTATGDMVLLFVIVKYGDARTINTPTDWTALNNGNAANSGLAAGNDAGNVRAAIFWREKDAGWSTMPAVDLDATPNCSMVGAISYTKGGSEAWVTPEGATAVDNTENAAGVDPAASSTTLALGTGDLLGSFCAQNGDAGTFSTHTCTVTGVTFGAQTTRLGAATSSGTDLRGHSIEKPYSSGTASAGPDGAMTLTAGAATTAGVFVFYRLRVGTTVAATMASALGALAGTMTATVQSPTIVNAVLAAPLGSLTASAAATVTPRIEAALVSNLGGLTATVTAVVTVPATHAAPLGALTATATATRVLPATLASSCGALTATMAATVQAGGVTVNAVLAAPLGQLTATASATVVPRIEAALVAPLGGLTATATATRQHPVTAVAACGGLTATATATVQHSALGAAPLGSLVATMNATVGLANVVDAVMVADLGRLVALANAGPPPPEPASVGFERFEGPSPAWGEVVSWVDALNEPMWEDFQV